MSEILTLADELIPLIFRFSLSLSLKKKKKKSNIKLGINSILQVPINSRYVAVITMVHGRKEIFLSKKLKTLLGL